MDRTSFRRVFPPSKLFVNLFFIKVIKGDLEREAELPISYLMDRYTVNKAKSQIGFIDVIIQPHFEVVKNFLPELNKFLKNLEINRKEWEERLEQYNEELNTLNKSK